MGVNPRAELREQVLGDRPQRGTHSILNLDPPDHTRLRGLVQQVFTPRTVEQLDAPGAGAGRRGARRRRRRRDAEIDVIADLAFPLPFRVISEMLGMPDVGGDAAPRLGAHAHARARAVAGAAAHGRDRRRVRPHDRARARRHRVEARAPGRRPAHRAASTPRHDGDRLSADELRRPGRPPVRRRPRDDRQPDRQRHARAAAQPRAARTVATTTRRSTPTRSTSCCATTAPVQFSRRVTTAELDVGGQHHRGGRASCSRASASANRDPAALGRRRRSRSTSPAPVRRSTWRSARASTTASARRWPGSRAASRSAP